MVIDPPQESPVVRLADGTGTYDLDKERGARAVLLYFGYTHCPDICPATLADWARAKRTLGSGADGVRFVFVSVDPERDTPQVVREYAHQFDPAFVGLSPTLAQLDSLKTAWGFAVMRDSTPEMKTGEYGVTHPAGTFLIDRTGKIREIFPPQTKPDDMAADLRRIK
jgi:protein SCO1/2